MTLIKKLLFGAAFLFVFSVFAKDRYPTEARATRTTVTVNVVWLKDTGATNRFCSLLSGELLPTNGILVGCYQPQTQTIFAVQPTSFNDAKHLEILGHEFWHALGAEHPEI